MSYLIANCTSEGILKSFNDKLLDLLGYSSEELYGMQITTFLFDKHQAPVKACELTQIETENKGPYQVKCKNGKTVSLWLSCSAVYSPDNTEADLALVAYLDKTDAITDNPTIDSSDIKHSTLPDNLVDKNANLTEKLLGNHKHHIASLTEHIPAYIYYIDDELCIRYVNDLVKTAFNQTASSLIGRHLSDIVDKDIYDVDLIHYQSALKGELTIFHREYKDKHGVRYFDISLIPDISKGDVNGFTILAYDVTEYKNIELKLLASEEKFRSLITNTSDIISIVDRNYCYLFMNHTTDGYDIERVIGQSMLTRVSEEDKKRVSDICDSIFMTGKPAFYEVLITSTTGKPVWYHAAANALYKNGEIDSLMFIASDITNLKSNEHQAKTARHHAESSNQAKSEFLSSMSHELRTPLNSILGFSQVLSSNPEEPLTETQQDCIKMIMEAGDHLLTLINEILTLSRIEAGKIEITTQDIDVQMLFEQCIESIEPDADNLDIQLDKSGWLCADIHVQADFLRLKQVLSNLLSNAVKYNHKGGKIVLQSSIQATGMFNISIRDTGIGIDPKMQDELFLPFTRLGAEATGIEGTGIGLTISKKLIEMMQGKIGYETTLGKGSTFWIEVPLKEEFTANKHAH